MTRLLTLFAALSLAAAATSGCAPTRTTSGAEISGFLGDYSKLGPGEEDEAQLIYVDEGADFSSYDALILDSVSIWHESDAAGLPPADQKALTDHLYAALYARLGKDYRIVGASGDGVLRLRVAITQAEGSVVVVDTITTVIPQLNLLSELSGMATDVSVFVGEASVEGELTDSSSGELLMAGVDQRVGGKRWGGVLDEWSDVRDAFDFWADRLALRLSALRLAASRRATNTKNR